MNSSLKLFEIEVQNCGGSYFAVAEDPTTAFKLVENHFLVNGRKCTMDHIKLIAQQCSNSGRCLLIQEK